MEDLRYDFAKETYKVECDRENSLNSKGQVYLSLLTIILSTLIFNIKDIFDLLNTSNFNNIKNEIKICLLGVFIFSCVALILLFFSMKIFEYQNLKNIDELKESYIQDKIDNNNFSIRRSIDFLVATKKNREVNNTKAKLLKIVFIAIFIAFVFSFLFLTLIITKI